MRCKTWIYIFSSKSSIVLNTWYEYELGLAESQWNYTESTYKLNTRWKMSYNDLEKQLCVIYGFSRKSRYWDTRLSTSHGSCLGEFHVYFNLTRIHVISIICSCNICYRMYGFILCQCKVMFWIWLQEKWVIVCKTNTRTLRVMRIEERDSCLRHYICYVNINTIRNELCFTNKRNPLYWLSLNEMRHDN